MAMHLKSKLLPRLLIMGLLAVLGISALITAEAAKKNGSSLVMFTASWCAACRPVGPIVQEVAGQNNLAYQSIDVDFQNAPAMAADFGLTIPSADLPQVYLVKAGRVSLLFDGRGFRMGKEELVRTTILNTLQQSL